MYCERVRIGEEAYLVGHFLVRTPVRIVSALSDIRHGVPLNTVRDIPLLRSAWLPADVWLLEC